MTLGDGLIKELDAEAKGTERVLERVPQDKLDWRPHPKSRTIGELAWHIAMLPKQGVTGLQKGKHEVSGARPTTRTGSDFVATFRQGLEELKTALKSTSDAVLLNETFSFVANDKPIRTFPKIGFVRTVVMNHIIHHRAQLMVYLRLLDVPVPAVYGTSADENPFAG